MMMNDEFSKFKTIFDNAPIGVFLTSIEGRIININNQLAKIFGYDSVEDIIERINNLSIDLYVNPEDRQKVLDETIGKRDITTFELKFKKKNRELIDARMSIRPYKSPDSEGDYFIGIVEDITEQKKLSEEVKLSEKKYRSLFQNSNDAIYILHSDKSVEFNEKAREIFELPSQLNNFNIVDISPTFQPDGQLSSKKIEFIVSKVLAGEAQKFEWLAYTYTGKEVYCDVTVNKLERGKESSIIAVARDISEKKKSEIKLIENEYKYRSLFEKSNDAIFIVNRGTIVEFNNLARKLFDIPDGKKQVSFDELYVEGQFNEKYSLELIQKHTNEAYNDELEKFDWILKSFAGKKLHCEVSISKIEIEKENYFLAIIRDVTERKKAEIKLIESEKRYRHLVDNAPIGIVRTKLDGEIVFVNNNIIKMLGFENFEELRKYFPNMMSVYKNSTDRELIINELSKGGILNSKLYINGKNKSQHLINFIASPEVNGKGEVEFINSIVEDISENERLENRIKEREETLTSVVNSFPFELVVTDRKNNLIVQNSCSKNLFGDLEGKKIEKILVPGETIEIWEQHANKVYNNEVLDYEREAVRNNKPFYYRIIKAPLIINSQVFGIIALSIDITERKRLQQEIENHRDNLESLVKKRTEEVRSLNKKLLLTNEELYATNDILSIQKSELEELIEELKQTQHQLIMSEKMASIGVLTAGIAHEINNPVNFISSGLTGLELVIKDILVVLSGCKQVCSPKNIENEDFEIRDAIDSLPKLIDSMRSGIHRTTEIVKGLRTFSRLDNENKSLSNVNELIDSALAILTNKYKYNITIEKHYNIEYPINCYPGKLSQVFLNLIVNAIQAIKDKGRITITTDSKNNGESIVITIKDDGEGIPEIDKNRIFDPFFTTKPVGEGTGLGLAIVHGIIQEHEGEIDLISERYKGSEFIITLPVN